MRQALFALLLFISGSPLVAAPHDLKKNHGSTSGMASDSPSLSAGIQFGNYGATGVTAQKVGVVGGAVNLGLGLAYGSISLAGDYVWVLGQDFKTKRLGRDGYNAFRGEVNPYLGAGAQFGLGSGLTLRFPAGFQYTMLKDPFNFFGGLALMYGRFLADADLGIQLWFMVGARVLL